MSTSDRKQREIHQREEMLLNLARTMLIDEGFTGLTLERLAEASEYSKGTIYQHFSAKEDLIAALANQSAAVRFSLHKRASLFPGKTREKIVALIVADELFSLLHPHHFRSELVIRMANLQTRASSSRMEKMQDIEGHTVELVLGIVNEAFVDGNLSPAPWCTPEIITFGLFSLVVGSQLGHLNFCDMIQRLGITQSNPAIRQNVETYLDGLGWKPLRSQWDYDLTAQRVRKEVFADDFQRLGNA
jgi:AcrR family transcriptional regulator